MCHWCYLVCLIPAHWLLDFKQVIVPVICFLVIFFLPCLLTRNWFVSCQQHMCHRFCLLCIYGVLVDFGSLFRFYCIWHRLLTRHWFAQCQQHLYVGVILQYNFGSVTAEFEQVIVSIRLFFTCVLCIYIILDKGCHILCVFGLNGTVCSYTVGVHLSSDTSLMTLW